MAGLLDYDKILGLLQASAGGGNTGGGGSVGLQDVPMSDSETVGANVNGYYEPGNGLNYDGWNAEYKKRFGKDLQQELMLRYGQDQQQSPNYGIQYKYNW